MGPVWRPARGTGTARHCPAPRRERGRRIRIELVHTTEGRTPGGAPVYNVAFHIEKPTGRPYALIEI